MTGIHKQGGGPSGNCICLKCGTKVPHQAATPWRSFLTRAAGHGGGVRECARQLCEQRKIVPLPRSAGGCVDEEHYRYISRRKTGRCAL